MSARKYGHLYLTASMLNVACRSRTRLPLPVWQLAPDVLELYVTAQSVSKVSAHQRKEASRRERWASTLNGSATTYKIRSEFGGMCPGNPLWRCVSLSSTDCGSTANHVVGAAAGMCGVPGTIAKVGADVERGLLAHLHLCDALIPALRRFN